MPVPTRAIDRLRKAANLEPTKREVELSDGSTFEMYVSPLTMAERERAQKQAKSDDVSAFALQLLISKAKDESGKKLFSAGEVDILKNEVKDPSSGTSERQLAHASVWRRQGTGHEPFPSPHQHDPGRAYRLERLLPDIERRPRKGNTTRQTPPLNRRLFYA
jgi:hypothetical protein